jgi:hypothetical protein
MTDRDRAYISWHWWGGSSMLDRAGCRPTRRYDRYGVNPMRSTMAWYLGSERNDSVAKS